MFECLEVAHAAVDQIGPIIDQIARRNADFADQVRRAAISIVSNIDEGRGASDRQKTHYFRTALGSAREVTSQLRVAHSWGYAEVRIEVLDLLDRLRAMLWRLSTR